MSQCSNESFASPTVEDTFVIRDSDILGSLTKTQNRDKHTHIAKCLKILNKKLRARKTLLYHTFELLTHI